MFDSQSSASLVPKPPRPSVAEVLQALRWRWNRLRCMTPAELPHRLWRALSVRAEACGLLQGAARTTVPPPELARAASKPWIRGGAQVDEAACLAAADRIVADRFDVFALHGVSLGSPPRWNRDPKTGVEAPLVFGKRLDYRDPRRVGDIKYLWEPNRHLHLVTLAQAWALSGDARYFRTLQAHLESWFDACPCGRGPNWTSALEAALRLINWSAAWQLLGGATSPLFDDAPGARLRERWLVSVHQHVEFVRGYFSLHSSANNHLVGEAAGVYIAALTWPLWPASAQWLAQAGRLLEREALLQNAQDGVNREQAVWYQHFELDLLLLPLLAARANGKSFPAAYEARIEAMIGYLASMMDVQGHVPMFGDADDGVVVNLAPQRDFCRWRSLVATGALLFERADFMAKAGRLDDKNRWLFGLGADAAFEQLRATGMRLPAQRAFPEGGYYVLGSDLDTGNEVRLVVDAGPLGYRRLAAHGHADALSFTLSVGGREFLLDPGTCAYHTQPQWRGYFRGTAAHNTVRVDGEDQSVPGGNFMWLTHARAGCLAWAPSAEIDTFEGWHDGYMRLADPVLHRRRIVFRKRARRIAIDDTLLMKGTHDIELYFHCSERCEVERQADGCLLALDGVTLRLLLPASAGGSVRVCRGSLAPILGWVSRHYDDRRPAPTIVWQGRLSGPAVLRSEIVLLP
jgi:hypothetical protein